MFLVIDIYLFPKVWISRTSGPSPTASPIPGQSTFFVSPNKLKSGALATGSGANKKKKKLVALAPNQKTATQGGPHMYPTTACLEVQRHYCGRR
jgi:hypothetical protein